MRCELMQLHYSLQTRILHFSRRGRNIPRMKPDSSNGNMPGAQPTSDGCCKRFESVPKHCAHSTGFLGGCILELFDQQIQHFVFGFIQRDAAAHVQ